MVYNHAADSPLAQLTRAYRSFLSGAMGGGGEAPEEPPSGKRFNDRLPQDPNAPESPTIDPALYFQMQENQKRQGQVQPQEEVADTAPEAAPQQSPAPDPLARFGNEISPPQFASPQSVPGSLVSRNEAIRTAMLQAGLNLLVPQWGGPLAQLGQAAGEGAEAVGRLSAGRRAQQNKGLDSQLTQAQIQATQALTNARKESAETSRAKRLRGAQGTSQYERLAAQLGLGPEGAAYFKERLKEVEEVDPLDADLKKDLGQPILSPMEQFAQILEEARQLDSDAAGGNKEAAGTKATPATDSTVKTVKTVEEARKLKSGTRFIFEGDDPNNVRVVP